MIIAPTDVALGPGTRMDQRYRLDARRGSGPGWSLWKATDEVLDRTIAIRAFEPARVRSLEVFDAVRRVSRLTHGGLARVFDANEDGDPPYLVGEWLGGPDLVEVLADGPLEPSRVAEVFRQVSAALAVAHQTGVGHLRLGPRSVAWSRSGHVKILGLGVEAVLAGVRVDDPSGADTRALGRLLRAALSGRGVAAEAPRPGPRAGLRAWLMQRSEVGRELTSIADRALGGGGRPIRSVARFADELRRVAPTGHRWTVDRGIGVSEPIPGLVRVRTRNDALAVSTLPIQIARVAREHRGIAA